MPISNPSQLLSANLDKWKSNAIQTNYSQYIDQPVIKPEPNRLVFSGKTSPNQTHNNIQTSVIRISPTESQLKLKISTTNKSRNNENVECSWSDHEILQKNVLNSEVKEQQGVILQNVLPSMSNQTSSDVKDLNDFYCSNPSSPNQNKIIVEKNLNESHNFLRHPSLEDCQKISYNTNYQKSDFLVIKRNLDVPFNNKTLTADDSIHKSSILDLPTTHTFQLNYPCIESPNHSQNETSHEVQIFIIIIVVIAIK